MKTLLRQLSCLLGLSLAGALHAASTTPKPVETPSPGYPKALTDSGMSGDAAIDLVVKADGSVSGARVKSADHEAFGEAALAAVKQWRFEPARIDGAPVDRQVTVPFKFAAPVTQVLNAKLKRRVFQEVPERVLSQKEYGKRPKPTKPLRPPYPAALKGKQLKVDVQFVIAPDGSTLNPEVLGTPRKEVVLPAIFAVAAAAYEPPVKDGKGVYVAVKTKLTFAPPRAAGKRGGRGGKSRGGGSGGAGFGDGGGGSPDE